VIERSGAANRIGDEVGFISFALGVDDRERKADFGPKSAEDHWAKRSEKIAPDR
jgi:hypothetical protein